MPRISVLMTAYNSEKYIGAAIESILNQTFSDFEFIIINDGSTDNTPKIIKEYAKKDKRIKFIDNKVNQGLIAVLNQGIDLCQCEYIARMDSDDISLEQRFEKQIKYMDEHPECGVLGTSIKIFGPSIKKDRFYKYPKQVKLLDFVLYGNQVAHPTTMIRRSLLINNNLRYNPQYKHAEDFALWAEIVRYTEIHNLQEILFNYRWYGNNVSVIHNKEQKECAEKITKDILESISSSKQYIHELLKLNCETNERFYLFGFLPFIRRKQYAITKTKYYLFEKIPIIKEQNNKIYLFEFIKIGSFK